MQKVNNWLQAIDVLIQAAEVGQQKGAFSLQDASIISQSIDILKAEVEKITSQAGTEKTEAEATEGPE